MARATFSASSAEAAPVIFTSTTLVIFSPSETILSASTAQAFQTASANSTRNSRGLRPH